MATFGEHQVTIIDTAELERLRADNARLKVLCDEGAAKIAEMRNEYARTSWYNEFRDAEAKRRDWQSAFDRETGKRIAAELRAGDLQLEAQAAQASEAVERRKRQEAEEKVGVWCRLYKDAEQKANHSDAFKRKAEKYEAALASILSETKLDTGYPWLKIGRINAIASGVVS